MAKAFEFHFNHPLPDTTDTLTNVLFINEAPADGELLQIEPQTAPGVSLTIKAVSDKEASKSNHHFKLTFRPGTLALPGDIRVESTQAAQWGLRCETETGDLIRGGEQYALGDVYLYVLYKGAEPLKVGSGKSLMLILNKVGAAAGKGTRPTLVQLTLPRNEDYVQLSGPAAGEYNLTESSDLGLISVRGTSAPALEAGFVSSDIVLNDGDTQNHLVLRIANTGPVPILLSSGTDANGKGASRFTLRVESSATPANEWALGTAAQVSSILIPGRPDSSTTDPNWPGHKLWTVEGPSTAGEWTLTPKSGNTTLGVGQAIDVPLSKVVTGHATGRTALLVRYAGLPGYSDGERVAFIQKYPLKFVGQRLGLGTASPSAKLTVETAAGEVGVTHTDGSVSLSMRLNGTGAATSRTAGFGTQTNHDLLLFTNNNVASPLMTLTTDGKVGIGTQTPQDALQVKTATRNDGISHTDGTRILGTYLDEEGGWVGLRTGHNLNFFTNDGEPPKMTLTTEGKVGIGTSDPDVALQVRTASRLHGLSHTDGARTISTWVDEFGGSLGTQTAHPLRFFTGGKSPQMTLTTEGRVGIGTEDPGFPLQVKTPSQEHGLSHTDGIHTLTTYVSDKGGWIGTKSDHDLNFFTCNKSPKMTLRTNGRLWLETKPFVCATFVLGNNVKELDTKYSSEDWVAVIAGWKCDAEDDPKDKDVDMYCQARPYYGNWWVQAHQTAGNDGWRIHVVFIDRNLVSGDYSY